MLAKIDVEGFEIRALNGIKRYIIILLIIIILFFIIIIIVIIIIKSLVEKDLVETLLIEIAPNRWDRPGLTVEEGNTNTNTNTKFNTNIILILILKRQNKAARKIQKEMRSFLKRKKVILILILLMFNLILILILIGSRGNHGCW